jgi:hypothetical protein
MNKLVAYLLLGLFLLQFVTKLYVEVDFLIHQTDIIEQLCENKDKPELQCNGKCYLMKQLQEVEDNFSTNSSESSDESAPRNYVKMLDFCEQLTTIESDYTYSLSEDRNRFHFQSLPVHAVANLIDHPPQA